MNYRHAFHAGNFADVFKHALLTRLLVYLTRKDAPLRFIDTHAGIGSYDLSADESQRTGEWRDGIGRVLEADFSPAASELLLPYLTLVRGGFAPGSTPVYPGSPVLAARLTRRSDRLILCELHPQDSQSLAACLGNDLRIKIVELDGYTGLKAFVPPPERRGLVLIDPPFELRDEFDKMQKAFLTAHAKWNTGVYAMWYPLKDPAAAQRFCAGLMRAGVRRILRAELWTRLYDPEGPLTGCGLIVVNPTHGFDDEARIILPELCACLATGPGPNWLVEWVVPE